MARKNEKIVIEDIELKPQVIGHIYQKKSNVGRVIIIFAIFGLIIYYINDISVFFNNMIGKKSSSNIENIIKDKNAKSNNKNITNDFYEFNDNLVLVVENLTITHFKYEDNLLSFDAYNYTEQAIDLNDKNLYLETFNNDKELLDSNKVTFSLIEAKENTSINVKVEKEFKYLRIIEK